MRYIGNTLNLPGSGKIRGFDNYRAALKRMQAPFDQAAHWRKTAKVLKLSKRACARLGRAISFQHLIGNLIGKSAFWRKRVVKYNN